MGYCGQLWHVKPLKVVAADCCLAITLSAEGFAGEHHGI
jgi:hypothetical protein